MNFSSFVVNLNSMGFYNFVLPWLLFIIIYDVILIKAPFWGENSKKSQLTIVVSAILAFFTVNYPMNGIPLGSMLSKFFGNSAIYFGGLLVILLFLGLANYNFTSLIGNKSGLAIVLVVLALIVLGASGFPQIYLSETTWTLLFMLIILGGALLFLGDKPAAPPAAKPEEGKKQ